MFAIALWDVQERTLHLAREHFGEKPLYCGWVNGAFVFGSGTQGAAFNPLFRPIFIVATALQNRSNLGGNDTVEPV